MEKTPFRLETLRVITCVIRVGCIRCHCRQRSEPLNLCWHNPLQFLSGEKKKKNPVSVHTLDSRDPSHWSSSITEVIIESVNSNVYDSKHTPQTLNWAQPLCQRQAAPPFSSSSRPSVSPPNGRLAQDKRICERRAQAALTTPRSCYAHMHHPG